MGFLQDLRFALRVLWKRAGLTAVIVLTLALGIGSNSAMFSVVRAIVLRPLDLPGIDRLVMIQEANPKRDRNWDDELAPRAVLDLQRDARSFEGLAAFQWWEGSLTGDGEPEQVLSFLVGPGFFPLLGVQPQLGRWFSDDEVDGKTENVIILGHRLWMRRYAGNPEIVGRTIQFNDRSYTVVGVMPNQVLFPVPAELWAPLTLSANERVDRRSRYVGLVGRLQAGVSLDQADAEIRVLGEQQAQQFPADNNGSVLRAVSLVRGVTGELTLGFSLTLLGAALFVLLIACANVANVFLAHAMARRRELAVRTALGAARGRIIRQLLTESALLGLFGSAFSLLFATWTVDLVKGAMSPRITRFIGGWNTMGVDTTVLLVTLATGVAVGLFFGVVPALQASHIDLNAVLKDGDRGTTEGRRSHRLRSILVVAQVSLALVLLVGAGELVSGFLRMANPDRDVSSEGVLTMRTQLNPARYPDPPAMLELERRALEKIVALPGVESAAITSAIPWGQLNFRRAPLPEGRDLPPEDVVGFDLRGISAGYLQLLGVPLREGRLLGAGDTRDAPPVALVSELAAKRLWPGSSPLGKRFRWSNDDAQKPWITVVGLVGDVVHKPEAKRPAPTLYMSREQNPTRAFYLVARTGGDPTALAKAVTGAFYSIDPNQPLQDVLPLAGVLRQEVSGVKVGSSMMAAFALLALLLAAVGIYGVAATMVVQRTHEIGVRVALGAQRSDVMRLILGKGLFLTSLGLALGVAMAFGLLRAMSGVLQGVVDDSTLLFAGITVAVAAVSMLGSYVPARRAARVDPMIALRHD